MKKARQMLEEARDLFRATHWVRGQYHGRIGTKDTYCAIGGLRYVGFDNADSAPDPDDVEAGREREEYLMTLGEYRDALSSLVQSWEVDVGDGDFIYAPPAEEMEEMGLLDLEDLVISRNDAEGTELEDVLEAFDAAIKRYEPEGAPS